MFVNSAFCCVCASGENGTSIFACSNLSRAGAKTSAIVRSSRTVRFSGLFRRVSLKLATRLAKVFTRAPW